MKCKEQMHPLKMRLKLALVLISLFFGALQAHASTEVSCTILTIEASNANQGIDQQLKEYAAIFKEKPFAAFNTFVLKNRETYAMPTLQPMRLALPDALGGSLKLLSTEGAQLSVVLTLQRQGSLPMEIKGTARPGAPFFAAGLRSAHGVWIFGVVCARGDFVEH